MQLFYREYGEQGPTLVILHGLYGASDNWVSIARQLSSDYRIFLVDQRNHGQSPHHDTHDYECMTQDLLEFLDNQKIDKAHLVGHSMGGKTAMRFALEHPERIHKLVVLDIAPKSYATFSNYAQITNNHEHIINSLLELQPENAETRQAIDQALALKLPNDELRHFLLKNIERTKDGHYRWRLNLPVIKKTLPIIMDGFSHLNPDEHKTNIPAIFIRGEKSDYVMDEDSLIIRKLFKDAEVVSIPNAGHWLHAQQPALLIKTLAYFLLD
ncbi:MULTISPECIES: alpha/beta fold hydrolase [unclassified Carboxylicivirga]|uniref:alpha/beta fold hydrolase n=1 Tax=Carboxylicivirga TaxID=1628153 RepID=UPI003D350776